MLTSMRQIALPEYRQGEHSGSRPSLRERVGPPLYRSGAGSSPASPCSCLKPTTPQEAPKTSRALRAPNKPSTTKQTGAGQSVSDAPQAPLAADCRPSQSTHHKPHKPTLNHKTVPHSCTAKSGRAFSPCKNEEIRKKRNHSKKNSTRTPCQALISAPSCSSSRLSRFLQKRLQKVRASPPLTQEGTQRQSEVQ